MCRLLHIDNISVTSYYDVNTFQTIVMSQVPLCDIIMSIVFCWCCHDTVVDVLQSPRPTKKLMAIIWQIPALWRSAPRYPIVQYSSTLKEESSQTNVILLAAILSAVCSVIQQS